MWARICEIILGLWLFLSHFIFGTSIVMDIAAAILIFIFAGLSYIPSLNKMHLLEIIPVGWLLYFAYTYPNPDPMAGFPFLVQNSILTALFLALFCCIPSRASNPPRPWQRFMRSGSDSTKR